MPQESKSSAALWNAAPTKRGKQGPTRIVIEITPELLEALQGEGPNEHGLYRLDAALWPSRVRRSNKSPHQTGSVKLPWKAPLTAKKAGEADES